MAEKKVNKVVINGVTELDLTADTVAASSLLEGATAHDRSGNAITGTMPSLASATGDATALASEMVVGKTAYVAGAKVTGTMPNIGKQEIQLSSLSASAISTGYHDGSGSAKVSSTEAAKVIPGNIKDGVSILGVTGSYTGSERVTLQAKSATPTFSSQSIVADSGYTGLSEVTVAAIPVTRTENAQGGVTVTVG